MNYEYRIPCNACYGVRGLADEVKSVSRDGPSAMAENRLECMTGHFDWSHDSDYRD